MSENEKPPMIGQWKYWYAGILVAELILIILFFILMNIYQ
jgi:hypothetical protein